MPLPNPPAPTPAVVESAPAAAGGNDSAGGKSGGKKRKAGDEEAGATPAPKKAKAAKDGKPSDKAKGTAAGKAASAAKDATTGKCKSPAGETVKRDGMAHDVTASGTVGTSSDAAAADGADGNARSTGAAAGSNGAPQLDSWARAVVFAHEVRWCSALPTELLARSGLRKGPMRELLGAYLPVLFSISLFEVGPGSKSFAYYAAATVAFVADKVLTFGGCDFRLHLNSGAATHTGLLRRLHEVASGRIEFVEFAFVPRPRIAPWLLAAMRLAPLLDLPGRTVVTTDIHDDLQLQNAQVRTLLTKMRREGRELCVTWWLADDCADDCLLSAPLPVPRIKQHVSDRWYHTCGSDGGLGVHAHMDAGMNICTGYGLREVVLAEHEGETFIEYLVDYVYGAPQIPHGIEEMAWDAYLYNAGWPLLMPKVLFSVHRSLLAGRDTKDPFKGVVISSDEPHKLRTSRQEIDVGKPTFGVSLPTCRHSQALDCAEDSALWAAKASGGKSGGKRKAEGGGASP